jgi:hypothetical protein
MKVSNRAPFYVNSGKRKEKLIIYAHSDPVLLRRS